RLSGRSIPVRRNNLSAHRASHGWRDVAPSFPPVGVATGVFLRNFSRAGQATRSSASRLGNGSDGARNRRSSRHGYLADPPGSAQRTNRSPDSLALSLGI